MPPPAKRAFRAGWRLPWYRGQSSRRRRYRVAALSGDADPTARDAAIGVRAPGYALGLVNSDGDTVVALEREATLAARQGVVLGIDAGCTLVVALTGRPVPATARIRPVPRWRSGWQNITAMFDRRAQGDDLMLVQTAELSTLRRATDQLPGD